MILTLENLGKTYENRHGRVQALCSLDLQIETGEIFGLLGPNGAGKTTGVRLIMGFLHPSSGRIRFNGQLLAPTDPRKGIGFLPESFRPNPQLNVAEYVRFQCQLAGIRGRDRLQHAVNSLLTLVGMEEFRNRRIAALSKGMGQRVGLAQAFAGRPDLLVLDEPTSGLDPVGRSEVIDLLLDLRSQGRAIFFCSHILSEVERLCDRIGILVDSRLQFVGTTSEFLARHQTDDMDTAFRQEVGCPRS